MTNVFWLQMELTERFKKQFITKKVLYECLDEIKSALGLIHPFPLCDLLEPLAGFVTVRFRPFKNPHICGMIDKRDPPEVSEIVVNSGNPQPTMRFGLYHETVHWFCHPPGGHYSVLGRGNQGIEDYQANEGAAELELPYRVFLPWMAEKLERAGKNPEPELIARIKEDAVRAFDTSAAIVYYRLEGLKYELEQVRNGVELGNLAFLSHAQLKARGIAVMSVNEAERRAGR